MSNKFKTLKIKIQVPEFRLYNRPNGVLVPHPACHALFYYYLITRRTYEDVILDPIVYEGEKDPEFDFKQVFTSVAAAYGVEPEAMIKFWPNVDLQCTLLGLPKLPEGDSFRFNSVPDIKPRDLVEHEKEKQMQRLIMPEDYKNVIN